jgi:DNA-binding NtrC family response regulator
MAETLEKVVKEKVEPLVEEAMHKYLGITVSEIKGDISDRIGKSPLLSYEINTSVSFKVAKKLFKKDFIKRMLHSHKGNIGIVARITGLDRRSVYRAIKEFGIDIKRIKSESIRMKHYRKEAVDTILRDTFGAYKTVLKADKLKKMYKGVEKLSSEIVRELPAIEMTWKEAEREFEKAYIKKILREMKGNISKAAKKMNIRYETLHRKIKRLGIRK